MQDSAFLETLRGAVPGALLDEVAAVDMPTLVVDRDHLLDVFRTLRDHEQLQFSLLADVTAADYLPAEPRFEVVYHLACLGEAYSTSAQPAPARRLRVKVRVPGDAAWVPSLTSIYPAVGWLEREVFDLMGIAFEGHPDLRRVLMPDDWEGHPLRKDYSVQIRKETASFEPIQLSVEEFAANVRARTERAERAAHARDRGDSGGRS